MKNNDLIIYEIEITKPSSYSFGRPSKKSYFLTVDKKNPKSIKKFDDFLKEKATNAEGRVNIRNYMKGTDFSYA